MSPNTRRPTDPAPERHTPQQALPPRQRRASPGPILSAEIGDRLVVPYPYRGGALRDGEIVLVFNFDGSPPYVVRWADTGREEFVHPPPGAYVHPVTDAGA